MTDFDEEPQFEEPTSDYGKNSGSLKTIAILLGAAIVLVLLIYFAY